MQQGKFIKTTHDKQEVFEMEILESFPLCGEIVSSHNNKRAWLSTETTSTTYAQH